MRVESIGRDLVLLEFEKDYTVEDLLFKGGKMFDGHQIALRKWELEIRSAERMKKGMELWNKVMRLPLHMWGRRMFESIGNGC